VRFRASEAAQACGGRLTGDDVDITGASFDTRLLQPGWLFLPTEPEPGAEGRDGHDFVEAAVQAGAAAVLARRAVPAPCVIEVADRPGAVMAAAAEITRWLRTRVEAQVSGRVIGITGSVGKTSTKEFTLAALGARWRTWGSPRSYNNDWGLPVTLMQAPDDVEALVFEMGMRGFGEIARLCELARPDVGVVTAVAEAHTERVGGLDGVARAKGELVEALPSGGLAVLNGDDARVAAMARRTVARTITYGSGPGVDVRVDDLRVDAGACASFTLHTPWGHADAALTVPGRHMAYNAAAAVAVAAALGADPSAAAAALATARPGAGRMTVSQLATGALLVDDAYNANPRSMRAALEALADLDVAHRVAVLGEMAELADADDHHRHIAAYAQSLGITVIAVATPRYGLEVTPLEGVAEHPALADLGAGCAVLVKGSRMARLERVVEVLRGR